MIRLRRSRRSATTPPNGATRSIGTATVNMMVPSASVLSVSWKTSHARTIC